MYFFVKVSTADMARIQTGVSYKVKKTGLVILWKCDTINTYGQRSRIDFAARE